MRFKTADKATVRRIPLFSLLALAGLIVALAGCGGSKSSSSSSASTPAAAPATTSSEASTSEKSSSSEQSSSGSSALTLAANTEGQLKYETSSLTAKAGKVSIDFENMSPVGHNVTVESSGGSVVGATPTLQGASKTLTLNLKPGTYKFFCSVPGHRSAGMEGTLTVK